MMPNKDQLGKLCCVDSGVKVWVKGQILYVFRKVQSCATAQLQQLMTSFLTAFVFLN